MPIVTSAEAARVVDRKVCFDAHSGAVHSGSVASGARSRHRERPAESNPWVFFAVTRTGSLHRPVQGGSQISQLNSNVPSRSRVEHPVLNFATESLVIVSRASYMVLASTYTFLVPDETRYWRTVGDS